MPRIFPFKVPIDPASLSGYIHLFAVLPEAVDVNRLVERIFSIRIDGKGPSCLKVGRPKVPSAAKLLTWELPSVVGRRICRSRWLKN